MLDIEKETTAEGELVLHIKGAVTIETVGLMREELLRSFDETNHLILDGSTIENIDFFGLQLLCAAHRTSIVLEKMLTWKNTISPELREQVAGAGFSRSCGCSLCPENIDCMWQSGVSDS